MSITTQFIPRLFRYSKLFNVAQVRLMASQRSQLSRPLPAGTWDSHMHVVNPDSYPLSPDAKYKPKPHTLGDAKSFYQTLGIENMVFVQPSIYATDNSCMLDALRELTPKHGRAVVELDPKTIDQGTLREWHDIGVRGVRVNLVSVGRDLSEQELREELQQYADVIRPLGWVLQVYVPMKMIAALESIVPELDVKFCIDHFGSPSLPKPYDPSKAIDPYSLPGFGSLVSLLKTGRVWVKLSAPYRISHDGKMRDLDAIGRELVKEAPDQVVYSTDWPHTRFDGIDSVPFIEMCYSWCGEGTGLIEKLFRTNAEKLWDVK